MALLVTVECSGLSVSIAGHLLVTARVVNGQGLLGLATHCTLRHQDTLMRAPLLAGMSLRRGMRPMLVYVPGAWSGERLPDVVWWYARLSVSPRMALLATVGCSGLSVAIADHLLAAACLVQSHGSLGHVLDCHLASPGYTHAFAIAGWHVLGGQDVAHDLLYSRFVVRSALA